MVFYVIFRSVKAPIYCNYKKKTNKNILQNVSLCPGRKNVISIAELTKTILFVNRNKAE